MIRTFFKRFAGVFRTRISVSDDVVFSHNGKVIYSGPAEQAPPEARELMERAKKELDEVEDVLNDQAAKLRKMAKEQGL
jgi:hypothetical protein